MKKKAIIAVMGVVIAFLALQLEISQCWATTIRTIQSGFVASGESPLRFDVNAIDSQPNVLLIIVDALRADHLSSYGYNRQTSPFLDAFIGAEGVQFSDVTSTAAWTHPSNAGTFTGIRSFNLGIRWEDDSAHLPEDVDTLAEHLQDAGYYTAGFVHPVVSNKLGFGQGFDLYVDGWSSEPDRWDNIRAGQINEYAMNWLDSNWTKEANDRQPLFLFMYYFDPHTWYDPPPPYDTLYDATYTGTLTSDVYQHGKDVVSGKIVPTERDVEHLIALYDGEIAYWDSQLEQFLIHLRDLDLLENTIIVVTSDHGEMFGEHDKWLHRSCLYEETLRVPLLVRYSGVISPNLVIETPVHNMDIMPTIMDLVNLPVPPGLDAVNLHPLIQGGTLKIKRDILSEQNGITDTSHPAYWLAPRYDLRSIRRDKWKLVHHMGGLSSDELYLLHPSSLYERNDLSGVETELVRNLREDLLTQLGEVFTITGRIADMSGAPFGGITVANQERITTVTSSNGAYSFTNLSPGTYVLTPTLTDYIFSPSKRTVSVPSDIDQNFVIMKGAISATVKPTCTTTLVYTNTQGLLTQLNVPANAVTRSTTLVLNPFLPKAKNGYAFARHAFELVAHWNEGEAMVSLLRRDWQGREFKSNGYERSIRQPHFAFSVPVTVTLHYNQEDMTAIADNEQLALYWWKDNQWQPATQTCVPDTEQLHSINDQTISVPICRTGRFGLFGPSYNLLYLPVILRDKL
jgi:arylsulfatase